MDRRLYRSRYDAARTLRQFATALQHDVEVESLAADVVEAVRATLQPTSVSLWLLPPASSGARAAGREQP